MPAEPRHISWRTCRIRSGTLVEVRLDARSSIFPAQDTWLPVRFESQLVAGPGGETELQAVGHVAIAATAGDQQEGADAVAMWGCDPLVGRHPWPGSAPRLRRGRAP